MARPTIRRAVATLVEHGVVQARGRSGLYFMEADPRELMVAAGNSVLLGVHHGLRQRIAWSRGATGAGVRQRSLATLQMLAAAIGAGDGPAAGAAMEQHLSEVLAVAQGLVGPS